MQLVAKGDFEMINAEIIQLFAIRLGKKNSSHAGKNWK